MRYLERAAPAALAGIATRLWVLEVDAERPFEKILPMPFVHLIVNLSAPYRIHDADGGATVVADAFVSRLQSGCLVIEPPDRIRHVGVELTPVGLSALAPAERAPTATDPPKAGAAAVRDARELLFGVDALVEQLESIAAGAAPLESALDVLEAFLLASTVRAPDALVVRALAAIDDDPATPVAALAAALGVSQRTLIARFRAATGTTPKQHQQVLRFHRFIDALHAAPQARHEPDWAVLAVESGFYDQPHVIRAFRRFSGWTPTGYLRMVAEHGPDAAHFVPLDRLPSAAA
ncbi:AraC family transcriptional regulator [Agrococcus beijingensis]|uniref:AraC family transcriptional regulator n=1 Tax=Agrococcus beijingensis TaxID=3068634 RepID=UPI0027407AFC|nr:helix-turn-helix domain-containing protein [Agrococcus sp. REN33]